MIKNIYNYVTTNHFETVFITCVLFILFYGLYRRLTNAKGTWSKTYFNPFINPINFNSQFERKKRRGPPTVSRGEAECKRVLENIFDKPFNKIRPNFLNNPVTGGDHNLEIDCYNEELKLGVEFNGAQHAKYIPFFHKNYEAFMNQKYRDELKRRMCKDNRITLIEVPHTVKTENIETYLIKELRRNGYDV